MFLFSLPEKRKEGTEKREAKGHKEQIPLVLFFFGTFFLFTEKKKVQEKSPKN